MYTATNIKKFEPTYLSKISSNLNWLPSLYELRDWLITESPAYNLMND